VAPQITILTIVFLIGIGLLHMFTRIVEAVAYVLVREDKEGMSRHELAKVFE
jgi:hypothetical protein